MDQQLLARLAKRACEERVVVSKKTANGVHLLAYPLEKGVLVALGFEREHAHQDRLDAMLRRRSEHLARFCDWLPALLADGSWYVVRRIAYIDSRSTALPLSSEELAEVQELLA